jgi:hypothetical protein
MWCKMSYASLLIVEYNDVGILLISVFYMEKCVIVLDDYVYASVLLDG